MQYPLISEYREAILSPEDNFSELSSLRPVIDSHGDPVMSSGNFAVVFKMEDVSDGKFYAVKCFIKDQEGRDESYRKIAEELDIVSSSYILPLRYLENELFVDSSQCDCEEFPVVVMEWVEGVTLESYLKRNLDDRYQLEMLSYRFNRMSAWLLAQSFAHGDLKPDNILVREDGSLVLVDYDGFFVPSMKGEKARETGSPDYRHPLRTDFDFDEHIDDFSIATIALSLKAIALDSKLKTAHEGTDSLLLSESDFKSPSTSEPLKAIQRLSDDSELSMLLGIFYIALAKNSIDALSFRLFMTPKPKPLAKPVPLPAPPIEKIGSSCPDEDIAEGIRDEFGVVYSKDGKRLLECKNYALTDYNVKPGTQVICDYAFSFCESLQSINIPDTVTTIGVEAFLDCESLQSINMPNSVTTIGEGAFSNCYSLHSVNLPNSMTSIVECMFLGCKLLQSVHIPNTVTSIGGDAFFGCDSLQSVNIPNSVTTIGEEAFLGCRSLESVHIPNSVTTIGDQAFLSCRSLESVHIPNSVTTIGDWAFSGCKLLQSVIIPNSVTTIGEGAFSGCRSLQCVIILNTVTTIGDNAFEDCPEINIIQD